MFAVDGLHGLPGDDAEEADEAEEQAEGEAGEQFAANDAEPIAQANFFEGHGADDEGGGLGAGVAAAADKQGDEKCEDDGLFDLTFVVTHGGGREHFSKKKNDEPAGAFFEHGKEASFEVRTVEGFHAADLLHIAGIEFAEDFDEVVGGDNSFHLASIIHDRNGADAVLDEEMGNLFFAGGFGDFEDIAGHNVGDGFVFFGADEIFEGDHAEKFLCVVEDVGVIDGFDLGELFAEIGDGLLDGLVGAEPGEAGIHEAAGFVVAVVEKRFGLLPGAIVHEAEEVVALLFGSGLEQVGGIVRGEEAHEDAALAFGDGEEQGSLGAGIEGEKEIVHEFVRELLEGGQALFLAQSGPAF